MSQQSSNVFLLAHYLGSALFILRKEGVGEKHEEEENGGKYHVGFDEKKPELAHRIKRGFVGRVEEYVQPSWRDYYKYTMSELYR